MLVAFTVCAVGNFRTAIQQFVSLCRSHPFSHNHRNSSFMWLCDYGPTEPCCNSDLVGISDVFVDFEFYHFVSVFKVLCDVGVSRVLILSRVQKDAESYSKTCMTPSPLLF